MKCRVVYNNNNREPNSIRVIINSVPDFYMGSGGVSYVIFLNASGLVFWLVGFMVLRHRLNVVRAIVPAHTSVIPSFSGDTVLWDEVFLSPPRNAFNVKHHVKAWLKCIDFCFSVSKRSRQACLPSFQRFRMTKPLYSRDFSEEKASERHGFAWKVGHARTSPLFIAKLLQITTKPTS